MIFFDSIIFTKRLVMMKFILNFEIVINFYENISFLAKMNETYADAIGAPDVPNVSWDDIGGLSHLKEEILSSLLKPVLPNGLRRSGTRNSSMIKLRYQIFFSFAILFRIITLWSSWNW